MSSGGLDGGLHDTLVLAAVRPLHIGLLPCHTHTRTSESTVSNEHGQQELRARAYMPRGNERWVRRVCKVRAAGAGACVPRTGAGDLRRAPHSGPAFTVNCLGHCEGALHAALGALGVTVTHHWRGHAWARCGGCSGEPARRRATAHAGPGTRRLQPRALKHCTGLNS